MLPLLKSLSLPLLSLVFMMMASGLFNTFVSIRLDLEGYSAEDIGIVISALYVGILVGSFQIDRWITYVGHVKAFVVFAATFAVLALVQALWINSWYWSGLRFIGGICMAGVFIVIESWLLMQSGPKIRGAILSIYLAVFYAALSLGQFLLNVADPRSIYPFCITSFLLMLSIFPITMKTISQPKNLKQSIRLSITQLFRISPLGFVGGVISGMLLAVVYGFVPLYAHDIGMSVSEIGTFMAVLIFGGFSLQWPLGRLADKGDRRKVLNVASFATAFLALALALFDHALSPLFLFFLAFIFGGFSFTLYPLSMAYACERVKEDQIVAATGGFVLTYGIGAIAGPLLAPIAIDFLGNAGIFYFLALISLTMGIVGLKRPIAAVLDE